MDIMNMKTRVHNIFFGFKYHINEDLFLNIRSILQIIDSCRSFFLVSVNLRPHPIISFPMLPQNLQLISDIDIYNFRSSLLNVMNNFNLYWLHMNINVSR